MTGKQTGLVLVRQSDRHRMIRQPNSGSSDNTDCYVSPYAKKVKDEVWFGQEKSLTHDQKCHTGKDHLNGVTS